MRGKQRGVCGGRGGDRREDQPKTNTELLTLSWVRPNRLNLLRHSVIPSERPDGVTSTSAPRGVKKCTRGREKETNQYGSLASSLPSLSCPYCHF